MTTEADKMYIFLKYRNYNLYPSLDTNLYCSTTQHLWIFHWFVHLWDLSLLWGLFRNENTNL